MCPSSETIEEVVDPRPAAAAARLAKRSNRKARRLVFFDNGKLSPPYDRWVPLVEPLIAELVSLGEVRREGCDLLSTPVSAHADMVSRWVRDGIDGIVFGLCDAGVTLPTVLLASAAEKAGIPTGVLCTSQVVELAAVASYFKVAGLPVVLVDADRLGGAQALRESATAAGEKIRAALTASDEALRADFSARHSFAAGLARDLHSPLSRQSFHADASRYHMSDGLPLVPPTPSLVGEMIDATSRSADEIIVDELSPSGAALTVRQAAICAVMAGCEPKQFPLVVAALQAMGAPGYKLHLAAITTHSCGNVVMFSGPAAREAGVASGRGCLGPAHAANATIGRALSLTLINVARAIPGISTLSLLGSSAQYTCCFADREDAALEPLYRTVGKGDESIVWAQKTEIHNVVDHISSNPESLLTTFCRVAATIGGNNGYMPSDLLLILNPEHAEVLARHGWTRADVQDFVFENARNLRSELTGRGVKAEWLPGWEALDRIPVVPTAKRVWTVVAGAPGPHSLVTVPWGYGDAVVGQVDA